MKPRLLVQSLACVAVTLFGAASLSFAQQAAFSLSNSVYQEVEVIGADGKPSRKRVPASNVVPGTEVIYVLRYRNNTREPAHNIVIDNPLDSTLSYVVGSARGDNADIDMSIDGGKTYGDLADLRVQLNNGRTRSARGSDVTHLRFALRLPVSPGDAGSVAFRAIVR